MTGHRVVVIGWRVTGKVTHPWVPKAVNCSMWEVPRAQERASPSLQISPPVVGWAMQWQMSPELLQPQRKPRAPRQQLEAVRQVREQEPPESIQPTVKLEISCPQPYSLIPWRQIAARWPCLALWRWIPCPSVPSGEFAVEPQTLGEE